MIEIIDITQIRKYQVIRFKKRPEHDFKKIKIGDKIFDPITTFDIPNCVAIESTDDHSNIKEIELLN